MVKNEKWRHDAVKLFTSHSSNFSHFKSLCVRMYEFEFFKFCSCSRNSLLSFKFFQFCVILGCEGDVLSIEFGKFVL